MKFNNSDYTPTIRKPQIFSDLPTGIYTVRITDERSKPTKKGDGEYLELTFQIMSGPHAGRLIFDRLNLRNPSDKAMEIAKSNLAAIFKAIGVTPSDSSELLGKSLRIETFNQSFEGKNYPKVKAYSALAKDDEHIKSNTSEFIDDLPF
jgi:Protein of unknown function (DUF669)